MRADIDEDPRAPSTSTLAELVGAIVIYYAVIEHWLDGMVFCIHDRVPGAKKIEKRRPYNAAQEFEFLRKSFNTLPDLLPFKDQGLSLLDKLRPLSEFRHSVVHGHIRSYNFGEGWLEFSRVVKGPNYAPLRQTVRVDIEELFGAAGDCWPSCRRLKTSRRAWSQSSLPSMALSKRAAALAGLSPVSSQS
ncbi:MAG TPA: hypothetical protein VGJ56_13180 [Reyranella sp.]|jgi:hypothetical protein